MPRESHIDYATLKPMNVRSVDSLVEMCALVPEGKKPDFVYVSTISVLEDEAMSNEGQGAWTTSPLRWQEVTLSQNGWLS